VPACRKIVPDLSASRTTVLGVSDTAQFLRTTRAGYDAIAEGYAERYGDELAAKPADRAILGLFAELVTGPVADIGCGPGRVTAHLAMLGVAAFGIDLSPGMVAVARKKHPHLRFDVGDMTELALPDAAVAGVLAWYSVIHVPDELLGRAFAEFHRVLVPGGYALLAFQVGDEPRVLTEAFGHTVALKFLRRHPERVAARLDAAGLPVWSTTLRQADEVESTPQAYLLARKPLS
jgi:SAM-dependent methyltransferase